MERGGKKKSKMSFAAKKIKGFVPGGDESMLNLVGRGLGSTEEQDPGEADSGVPRPRCGLSFLATEGLPGAPVCPIGHFMDCQRTPRNPQPFFSSCQPFPRTQAKREGRTATRGTGSPRHLCWGWERLGGAGSSGAIVNLQLSSDMWESLLRACLFHRVLL